MPAACNDRRRHVVGFDREAERLKQLARARCMRRAVAGRIVARHLDEFGQESDLALELADRHIAEMLSETVMNA